MSVFLTHWHSLMLVTCAFVAFKCALVSRRGSLIPCWDERHWGQSFVSLCGSSNLARMLSSSAGPCSHTPASGLAILAALNCKTHSPPLTSALSSLLAIIIVWIQTDQRDSFIHWMYCCIVLLVTVQPGETVNKRSQCCFFLSLAVPPHNPRGLEDAL